MNVLANCPGCGFRGRLPGTLSGVKTIVCPNCKTAVPVDQLRQSDAAPADDTFPIWVDGAPTVAAPIPPVSVEVSEPLTYAGDYMKDEAVRFAQYVAARLSELHARRRELAEAESRFESMTMEKKQELFRTHGAVARDIEQLKGREAAVQAREAALATRAAALSAHEAELAAREARVTRSEARAADADRRTAELRAAIDQLDAGRAALTEERAELARRAEALDKAELAMHRRFAELDEITS
jgi:uncharacterized protein (DUF3084 family)